MIWLRDNAAKRNIRRHRAHWAVVLGCIGLFVLHTVLNRDFRSVFRSVSDYISDKFCIVCTHTALFYQIIFQIIFTSLVPGLRMCRRSWAAERSLPWYHSCRLKSIMLQVRCSAEYSVFCFVFAVTSRWQQRVWMFAEVIFLCTRLLFLEICIRQPWSVTLLARICFNLLAANISCTATQRSTRYPLNQPSPPTSS